MRREFLLLAALSAAAAAPIANQPAALAPDANSAPVDEAALSRLRALLATRPPDALGGAMERLLAGSDTADGELEARLLDVLHSAANASRAFASNEQLLAPQTTSGELALLCRCGETVWSSASERIVTAPADKSRVAGSNKCPVQDTAGAYPADPGKGVFGTGVPGTPYCYDSAATTTDTKMCDPCNVSPDAGQIAVAWRDSMSAVTDTDKTVTGTDGKAGEGAPCFAPVYSGTGTKGAWRLQMELAFRNSQWMWIPVDTTTSGSGNTIAALSPAITSAVYNPKSDPFVKATVTKGSFPSTWLLGPSTFTLPPNTPYRFMVGAEYAACPPPPPSPPPTS